MKLCRNGSENESTSQYYGIAVFTTDISIIKVVRARLKTKAKISMKAKKKTEAEQFAQAR